MIFTKITSSLPSWNQSKASLFTMGLCSAFFLSCRQDNLSIAPSDEPVRVNVTLADFAISMEDDATRASDKNATEAAVNRIAFAVFDKDNKAVYSETEDVSAADFGSFSFLVIPGDYTFVTVAHKASGEDDMAAEIKSISEATIETSKVLNTYSCTKTVSVVPNKTQSFSVECGQRRTSTFRLHCTDETPSNVATCEIIITPSASYSTSYTFNPGTGLVSAMQQHKVSFAVTGTDHNSLKGVNLNAQCFLASETQSIDVTVNMRDASGSVVKTRDFKSIPMKQHRVTQASGPFFHSTANVSFLFDITDDATHFVNFE